MPMLLSSALALPAYATAPAIGDATIFATLPADRRWPEGVVTDDHAKLVYVTQPAAPGTAGGPPSSVLVYDRQHGDLLTVLEVPGEDLSQEHANVEGAIGPDDAMYVNNTQLGVVRFERSGNPGAYTWSGSQYTSGGFPIVVPVPPIPGLPPALPNGMAFGPEGELFVTDSVQGVLFRVPPGGGVPEPVLVDPSLGFFGGGRMGMNGVKLDPDRGWLYFSFTGGDPDGAGPAPGVDGAIHRVALDDLDVPELVYGYGPDDLPDGLAFDRDGDLFVVLAGANAISILSDLDGTPFESGRIDGPTGVAVPFAEPSTISLDPNGRYALVVNHALDTVAPGDPLPDPSPFVVYEVYVGVRGDNLP